MQQQQKVLGPPAPGAQNQEVVTSALCECGSAWPLLANYAIEVKKKSQHRLSVATIN
jgi:hypothetical protein